VFDSFQVDRHVHFKGKVSALEAELECWRPEMKMRVPAKFHAYIVRTMDQVRRVLSPILIQGYQLEACKKDCIVFWSGNGSAALAKCPKCGAKRDCNKAPRRIVHYYSLEEYIRVLMRIPAFERATRKETILNDMASPVFEDVAQGTTFADQMRSCQDADNVFPLLGYLDALLVEENPPASLAPFLAANAALPVHVRFKFSAMMLLALLPK